MKIIRSVLSALITSATLFASSVQASCGHCSENCQSQAGVLQQLRLSFLGDNGGTGTSCGGGEARNDLNAYKYGKYCGASNFCNANNADVTTPCNPIDQACQDHDACYAGDSCALSQDEKCECDRDFILSLIGAVTPGGNECDAASGDELCSSTDCPYDESGYSIICLFCTIAAEDGCDVPQCGADELVSVCESFFGVILGGSP